MTVYVDNWRQEATVGIHHARWSHMTADSKEELHEFATKIGLRRSWFQDQPYGGWHYDVTETKRKAAIREGAVAIPWQEFHKVWTKPGREGRPPENVRAN